MKIHCTGACYINAIFGKINFLYLSNPDVTTEVITLLCCCHKSVHGRYLCSYLELLFFVQQALFLWSWAESALHIVLQILNRHCWLVRHYCTVPTQHDNRYRLIALQ